MEGDLAQPNVSAVRVFSQNVAKNALHVDALLSELRNKFDVIFLQEPPWRVIHRVPSTTNRQGDEIVGAPKHPDWQPILLHLYIKIGCCPRRSIRPEGQLPTT